MILSQDQEKTRIWTDERQDHRLAYAQIQILSLMPIALPSEISLASLPDSFPFGTSLVEFILNVNMLPVEVSMI